MRVHPAFCRASIRSERRGVERLASGGPTESTDRRFMLSSHLRMGTMNAIESVVGSRDGVEVLPRRFGGREFTPGGRELGDRQVDVPFPKRVRDVVLEAGLVSKHHHFPSPAG